MNKFDNILGKAERGERLEHSDALNLANFDDVAQLMTAASLLRDRKFGNVVTYSKKIFIPKTKCIQYC